MMPLKTEQAAKEKLAKAFAPLSVHRWNIEYRGDEIWYCRGAHERAAPCEWEKFEC